MAYNTETLDRLYLEWSQFTQAKTRNEIMLERYIQESLNWLEAGRPDNAKKVLRDAIRTQIKREG